MEDPTGNRRYWCALATKINLDALRRDREQLWAEAVHCYRAGEKLWLEGELYAKAESAQRKRATRHPWQIDIEKLVRGVNKISQEDVWQALIITDRTKRTPQNHAAIVSIMAGLGFVSQRVQMRGGVYESYWMREDSEPDLLDNVQQQKDHEDIPW